MDTYVTVTALGPHARAGIDSAFARLALAERRFNHLDSTSPLFAFNAGPGPLVDSELVAMVTAALKVGAASGGAFDITVEPLVRCWGFYDGLPVLPSPAAIDSCLRFVGPGRLARRGAVVEKLVPGTRIDLGGIAKGHALGAAAAGLRAAGVGSGIIDAGGDVYLVGTQNGRPWRVGIRDPRGDGIIAVLQATDRAVVTSGDYERRLDSAGTRYSHIIDPRTGRPAAGVASVTVTGEDPARADAWATALFVLGPAGIPAAESAGFDVLIIDTAGVWTRTAGMQMERKRKAPSGRTTADRSQTAEDSRSQGK